MDQETINKESSRYEALVAEFIENGFTRQQAVFLINLLTSLIPIV